MGKSRLDEELYRYVLLKNILLKTHFIILEKMCFKYVDSKEYSPSASPFHLSPFLVLYILIKDPIQWFYLPRADMMVALKARITFSR